MWHLQQFKFIGCRNVSFFCFIGFYLFYKQTLSSSLNVWRRIKQWESITWTNFDGFIIFFFRFFIVVVVVFFFFFLCRLSCDGGARDGGWWDRSRWVDVFDASIRHAGRPLGPLAHLAIGIARYLAAARSVTLARQMRDKTRKKKKTKKKKSDVLETSHLSSLRSGSPSITRNSPPLNETLHPRVYTSICGCVDIKDPAGWRIIRKKGARVCGWWRRRDLLRRSVSVSNPRSDSIYSHSQSLLYHVCVCTTRPPSYGIWHSILR